VQRILPSSLWIKKNAGAERIFGYKETEIIGRPGGILFLPEDRERGIPEDEFGRAIKDGRAVDERYHLRKDGTHFYASGVMSLMQDGEFHGYVKILRDLTEKRQADEILRNAHKELEQKVEERTSELAKINKNLHEEIVERRRAEEQRRYLLRQLITAQEEERSRISRELHDQMGQHISALLFGLKTLKDKVGNNDSLTGQFERLQKIAQELDHEIDNLASELRPPSLDLGLHNALLQNIQGWKDFSKIDVDFHSVGLEQLKLSSYIESTIYRVVQEALNNIHKHSQAKQVGIILEHRGDDVIVIVENDGPGFDVEAVTQLSHRSRKLGLVGMQERVKLVGGTFNIESSESGTTIFIRIPISMDEVKGGEE
jgi:PAS domain S-box-containing protein